MCVIYLCFYRALKAQGFDRNDLPYKGWFQPYSGWIGLVAMIVTVVGYGYTVFLPNGCKFPLSIKFNYPLILWHRVERWNFLLILHYDIFLHSGLCWLEGHQEDEIYQSF